MTPWTIDTSAAVKWYLPEIHSDHALKWRREEYVLFAPDLLFPEIGSILWKRFRRKELTAPEVQRIVGEVDAFPFRVVPMKNLASSAVELAIRMDHSVYDCIYLAAAIAFDAPVVTADEKFLRAVNAGSLGRHIWWIEDAPK